MAAPSLAPALIAPPAHMDENLLLPFQKEGVARGVALNGRVLLADEMGLGKTVQAIASACFYRNEWPLLVLAPSSLKLVWRDELLRWLSSSMGPNGLPCLRPEEVNVVRLTLITSPQLSKYPFTPTPRTSLCA